jgi:hypothetical protein
MRRTTAILTVCLSAAAGCSGGAAQEPYDGVIAAARRPAKAAANPAQQPPEPQPTASEIDVPWTIALLSNAKTSSVKKAGKVTVVDIESGVPERIVRAADFHVAVNPRSAGEKPATSKTCSGVVNRRS